MMALQFFVVLTIYPETKGIALEDMDKRLALRARRRHILPLVTVVFLPLSAQWAKVQLRVPAGGLLVREFHVSKPDSTIAV
jgi:hypothetical protein